MLVVGLFEPGCPKRSGMYLKSQNEAAVESSRHVPTKDEARKWYAADIKLIILCTDQGDISLRSGTQKLLGEGVCRVV